MRGGSGKAVKYTQTACSKSSKAKKAYGQRTAASPLKRSKINVPPISGASVVPKELKACARFKRLLAVSAGPMMATNGLAAICSKVNPSPSTNSATRYRP